MLVTNKALKDKPTEPCSSPLPRHSAHPPAYRLSAPLTAVSFLAVKWQQASVATEKERKEDGAMAALKPQHGQGAGEDVGHISSQSPFLSTRMHVWVSTQGRTVVPGHVCEAHAHPPLEERDTCTQWRAPSAGPECHQVLSLMHLHQALPVCHLHALLPSWGFSLVLFLYYWCSSSVSSHITTGA